ncbi:MAG: hypothetical protein OSA93_14500 [Akkermansiaceae bacterium]|jgi:uncharacterized protein (TIGR02001 family)|nr:hypothetical protein [Akkermansiaceae bacterium]
MKKTFTILAIGSALALGSAQAEIESSFHVGYSTDYVFRGANQGEGLYEYGIDFSGDASGGNTWNAGVWRADFSDGLSEETDIYGSVSKEFGAVELSLGLIRYDFGSGAAGDTSEIFLGAGTELCGLSLAAVAYYDVDAADGNMYGELSAGKSYEVGEGATLNLIATIGSTIDGGAGDDYVTYGLKAALSKELGDNLTGSIYIAGEITEGVRAASNEGDDLVGGLSLSYGF